MLLRVGFRAALLSTITAETHSDSIDLSVTVQTVQQLYIISLVHLFSDRDVMSDEVRIHFSLVRSGLLIYNVGWLMMVMNSK